MHKKLIVLACLAVAIPIGSAVAGTVSTLVEIEANGGITLDSTGDIYAANYGPLNDTSGSRFVWKISPTGAFDPVIFASDINIASGNDFDSQGNLFQSNFGGNSISKIDQSGIVTTFSTAVLGPIGIAIDDADNLFVANCHRNDISRIEPNGTATIFATSPLFTCPNGMTRDANGDLYVINWNDGQILQVTMTGDVSTFASVPQPGGHVTIAGDRLYATSFGHHRVFEIELRGASAGTQLATIGTGAQGSAGGSYTQASFNRPNGITADASGQVLYVTDATGVRKIELEDEAPAPPPPPPPPPPPTPDPTPSGGGGSFSWELLLFASLSLWRRKRLCTKSGASG
jgi:sugar lactone lactonase YvrE